MSTDDFLLVETPRPHVRLVTLNRPARMNAMAFDVMVPLRQQLEALSEDNDGLGLPTIALRSMGMLEKVVSTIRTMHQPVIGAINGAAIGGGFCLALATDVRVVAKSAYFRAAGINNGLTASELGLSYLLPRTIGQGRAAEIMLTGRDVSAEESLAIGIASRVEDDDRLLESALELAERITGFSQVGIEMTKRSLWHSLDASSLEQHMEHEGLGQLFIRLTTKNFEEAIRARRDKRPPVFRD